jgi:hypothetical protein
MPTDHHQNQQEGLTSPFNDAAEVTPSDSTDLSNTTRAIYVGSQGSLKVRMAGSGNDVTFVLDKHSLLEIRVTRVLATGTSASNIVALW